MKSGPNETTDSMVIIEQSSLKRLVVTLSPNGIGAMHEFRITSESQWLPNGPAVHMSWDDFERINTARSTLKL
jgi:hypothetical protein